MLDAMYGGNIACRMPCMGSYVHNTPTLSRGMGNNKYRNERSESKKEQHYKKIKLLYVRESHN